jgi:hypothetical protein
MSSFETQASPAPQDEAAAFETGCYASHAFSENQ